MLLCGGHITITPILKQYIKNNSIINQVSYHYIIPIITFGLFVCFFCRFFKVKLQLILCQLKYQSRLQWHIGFWRQRYQRCIKGKPRAEVAWVSGASCCYGYLSSVVHLPPPPPQSGTRWGQTGDPFPSCQSQS